MGRRAVSGGQGGYILYVALGFLILLGLVALMATESTVSQVQSAGQEARDKRAFFRAEGGGNLCLWVLRNRLKTDLNAWLKTQTNMVNVQPYVTGNDPAGLLADHAFQGAISYYNKPFTRVNATRTEINDLSYTAAGGGTHECDLAVEARGNPVNQGPTFAPDYLFRYSYAIDSSATGGRVAREVNAQGSFTVRVQQDNFARYALFTQEQKNKAGQQVWFFGGTSFSGPVHTNGKFNFAYNPTFKGEVTSKDQKANYYNGGGSVVDVDADYNGTVDVPIFEQGFQRNAQDIPMPGSGIGDNQAKIALGLAETASLPSLTDGVYLGSSGTSMTGGIYIQGDATLAMGVLGGDRAEYTITQGGTTTRVRVDYSSNQTQIKVGGGGWTTYTGLPNGMIYTYGNLTGLSGAVEKHSQVTVAAKEAITITGNITYENYTAGTTPSAEGTTNLLGILSWNKDVVVATGTPNDIKIHATVMTPNGEFTVEGWDTRAAQGTATVLGGVIEKTYGAFGTFSGGVLNSGYGRKFVYDTRMGSGMAPPFFPTTGKLVGTISGIDARPNWQQMR